jgi:PAS domain S-box-containing protein
MPLDFTSVAATLGALGAVVGPAATWLYYRVQEKHKSTLDEYRDFIERQKADYLALKADYATLWSQYQDAEVRHDREMAELRQQMGDLRARCDEKFLKMADKISRSQVLEQQLRSELFASRAAELAARAGVNPFFTPDTFAFCSIVTDQDGTILQANPVAEMLFHWSEEEMIGRPVTLIIPERYHAAHAAGMAAVAARGGVSRQGRVIAGFGRTRNGEEIPVEMYLESWRAGDNAVRCGALIRRKWRTTAAAGLTSDPELPVLAPVPVHVVNTPVPVAPTPPPAPPPPAAPGVPG